jgi:single-strand DNA-binding protein
VNRPQTANAGQQEADFFRVSAWGKLGENCSKWLIKGKKVAVTGRVSVSTYTTQKGETRAQMDVMAESVEFSFPHRPPVHNTPPIPQTDRQSGFVQVDEDDLPFE